jgi:hypothetical protein
MTSYRRLKFHELPVDLQAKLNERDFLRASEASNQKSVIVWMVDRNRNARIEVEWDPIRGDFVSFAERMSKLDKPAQMRFDEIGGEARIRYFLDPATESLTEEVSFHSFNGGLEIFDVRQCVYSPAKLETSDLVKRELERVGFLNRYAAWPINKRIDYWVAALYRLHRSASESGTGEDLAFGAETVEKMRNVDPHIESLLRPILSGLAEMEGADASELIRRFSQRTGLHF